MITVTC